jgi:hypothetical protein
MLSYEELCAALERYSARHPVEAPPSHTDEHALPPVIDPPTGETALPSPLGMDDDHTNVGLQPIHDDHSNELDIGDVLSDEDAHKN